MRRKGQYGASLFNGTAYQDATHPGKTSQAKLKKNLFANKQPQTRQKHDILTYYLQPWIKIISNHFKTAAYVDCFAGPGVCDSGEACSPVLAAQILSKHSSAIRILLYAIEERRDIFSRLDGNLKIFRNHLCIETINDTFRSALPRVIEAISSIGKDVPSFFFIDPYGYKDVRFMDIESILSLPHSEVLVHFPYNGLVRGLGVPAVHNTIDEYYGQANVANALWRAAPQERKNLMVTTFEQRFRDLGCYTRSFEISMAWADGPYFYMVYMTREPIGYIIMNDIWVKHEEKRKGVRKDQTITLFGVESQDASQDTLMSFMTSEFADKRAYRKEVIATVLMHHRSKRRAVDDALAALEHEGYVTIKRDKKHRRRGEYDLCIFV